MAGYIASLSKDQAVIFNEIPYLGLALTKAVNTFVNSVKDQPDFSTLLEELGKLLNGEESSLSFNLPTVGNITSFQTVNEIAHLARILGPFLGAAAHAYFSNLVTAAVASAALGYGLTTFALQPTVSMPHHGGLLQNPINLHSQALMVLLTFAASKNYEDWKAVGKPLLDALFSDDVGNAANATQLQGYGGASPKLMAAIAYSTVDPGSATVFGDTGALSLFDDANDLGYVINLPDHNPFFETPIKIGDGILATIFTKDVTTVLARIATQYAGALALYEVKDSAAKQVLGNAGATGGVLALSEDDSALALDLSSILWGDVLKTGGVEGAPDRLQPINEQEFREAFFRQSAETSRSLIAQNSQQADWRFGLRD